MAVPYQHSNVANVRYGTQLGALIGVGPFSLDTEGVSAAVCIVGSLTGRTVWSTEGHFDAVSVDGGVACVSPPSARSTIDAQVGAIGHSGEEPL
jgi:hypothetical protein